MTSFTKFSSDLGIISVGLFHQAWKFYYVNPSLKVELNHVIRGIICFIMLQFIIYQIGVRRQPDGVRVKIAWSLHFWKGRSSIIPNRNPTGIIMYLYVYSYIYISIQTMHFFEDKSNDARSPINSHSLNLPKWVILITHLLILRRVFLGKGGKTSKKQQRKRVES